MRSNRFVVFASLFALPLVACGTSHGDVARPDMGGGDGSITGDGSTGHDGGGSDMGCVLMDCPMPPSGCYYLPDTTCCGHLVCTDGGAHDSGPADMRPDMDCSLVDCGPVPGGCTVVDDGSCCGMVICGDGGGCTPVICPPPSGPDCRVDPCTCEEVCAGVDAGCSPLPCPAPPSGCIIIDPCTCAIACAGDRDGGPPDTDDAGGPLCGPGVLGDICRSAVDCHCGLVCRACGLPGPGRVTTCDDPDAICPL